MSADNLYEALSEERKKLQAENKLPEWYTTGAWQMFKKKYLYEADSVRDQFERICRTAAKHLPEQYRQEAYDNFFNLMWDNILSPSTPVLSNMGTDRGLPVSCQGQYVDDSILSIYQNKLEIAVHTKAGFGTSAYLGNVRPRGTPIHGGGYAEGVQPVWRGVINDMQYVSQGNTRRGSFAGYIPLEHGDFHECLDFCEAFPDDANIGINISDSTLSRIEERHKDALDRVSRLLEFKMRTGRGYLFFPDKANRNAPEAIKRSGVPIQASNLCNEIALPSDDELYTFVCVLSSVNVLHWEKIKNSKAVFWATVFLDCVNQEFIERAENTKGLEKSVRFARDFRALGLGQCGFHSLLQSKMIPFGSFESIMLNQDIARHIDAESMEASKWLASILGEPKWCRGLGYRNATRLAIAPTKSTALLMGGVSEGINPDPGMVYVQDSAGGVINRINGFLLKIMKERGAYNPEAVERLAVTGGSVQNEDWLTDHEKMVFRHAFELNMESHILMASHRGRHLDQWQSFNLFFSSAENPKYIAYLFRKMMFDESIRGIYYTYSTRSAKAAPRICEACQ